MLTWTAIIIANVWVWFAGCISVKDPKDGRDVKTYFFMNTISVYNSN